MLVTTYQTTAQYPYSKTPRSASGRLRARAAALELEPEASGLPPAVHQMLKEREVEARYPVEVQAAADVAEAAGIIGTAHKAAVAAVQNELIAAGGS